MRTTVGNVDFTRMRIQVVDATKLNDEVHDLAIAVLDTQLIACSQLVEIIEDGPPAGLSSEVAIDHRTTLFPWFWTQFVPTHVAMPLWHIDFFCCSKADTFDDSIDFDAWDFEAYGGPNLSFLGDVFGR